MPRAVSVIHSRPNLFDHITKLEILSLDHCVNGEEAQPDEMVLILIWEQLFPGFSHHDVQAFKPLSLLH